MGGYGGGGALGGLAQGMLAGRQLRVQMQRAADEHQQMLQMQQERQQEMANRDLQTRMQLAQYARPISDAGTITEAAPNGAGGVPGIPVSQYDTQPPGLLRKARTADTYTHQGQQYEIMTAEEQNRRQNQLSLQTRQSTGIPLNTAQSPYLQSMGLSGTPYIDPKELPTFVSGMRWGMPVDTRALLGAGQQQPATDENGQPTPPALDSSGKIIDAMSPSTIPMGAVNAATRVYGTQQNNATRREEGAANRTAKADLTDKQLKARDAIAAANRAAANTRAANTNTTAVHVANIRHSPTPEKPSVQNRFDQKRMDAAIKEENKAHSARAELGDILKAGKDKDNTDLTQNPGRRAFLEGRYKASTAAVQSIQLSKASIAKAQAPSKKDMDALPEGQPKAGPDGHIWHKQDGIVYFDR